MKTKLVLFVTALLALPAANSAQSQGGSTGGTTSPANPTMGPAASSDVGKYNKWNSLEQQGRSGDYLVGNVSVAGGALPWDPIPLTVTCNGKPRFTSTTDPKGNFVIAPVKTDDSAIGNRDTKTKLAAQFVGCVVQAALPGFDSSAITIANRNMLDDPNIGTITLKREDTSAGAAVSSTTASAPKDATKAFEKARTELLDGKPDRAQKDLERAVQVYPQFAEAWYQLGRIQEVSKKGDAENSYTKAIAADPKFVLPYQQLAPMAAQAGKWKELVDYTSHELELNPRGNPQTSYYNALGNLKTGKMDVAETSAEKAFAMDPLHTAPNTEQLLAVILVGKRDYAGALNHLRSSLTYVPPGPNADVIKQQVAQLEPMVETPK
jgi:tetratricopeptide (TPR) repeat protein